MDAPNYFIPDRDPRAFYPLRDFLRAPSASVAAKYIDALTAPGDLVIDPFGNMLTVARTASALGRRAISVESNPLWAWLARAMATLPPASEIDAALARLGDALKDDAPLRVHINQLYATTCAACGKLTPADYFVHTRGAGPTQRHYTCAHCGATRDDPISEDDLRRFESFNARGIHYHLAFERVVPADNLHAERVRKMLDLYTARNLYALVTLTSKIDSLFHATREQSILRLLLLHLLDRGTSFYAAPDATAQLTAHKQFIEFNLWREIETAARALANSSPALDLAESVSAVSAANVPRAFVGRGSAKTIAREIPRESAALVIAAPPTRRVAVWALSYFWGAWVLGRATVQSLVPFLDSKKDATWEWHWYSDALAEALSAIAGLLRTDAHAVFVFTESWHQVIETLLLAATGARLQLESFLFQPRLGDFPHREFDDIRGEYRVAFSSASFPRGGQEVGVESRLRETALDAASDILARRGEALAFSWVHHAAFARLARKGLLADALAAKLKMPVGRFVHDAVIAGLHEGYAQDFDHYESKEQFLWLRRSNALDAPLIDRVDDAVREILSRGAPVSREELEDALYRQFPGDLTPEAGLVELCAAAYADRFARDGAWRWRVEDADAEKARALDVLTRLGERLEYVVERPDRFEKPVRSALFDLVWKSNGEIAHGFIWRDRVHFADVIAIHIAPACGYIVIPEARAALLREKTRRLPHLADAFHEAGWHFVRMPFAEKLLNAEKIERSDVALMAGLMPPAAEDKTQLELF